MSRRIFGSFLSWLQDRQGDVFVVATSNDVSTLPAEFIPKVNRRTSDGVMQRVKAHLDSVLLTYKPAYTNAQVLAMRENEVTIDDELMPPQVDKGLLERCKKLGIALPEHMAALVAEDDEEVDDSQS